MKKIYEKLEEEKKRIEQLNERVEELIVLLATRGYFGCSTKYIKDMEKEIRAWAKENGFDLLEFEELSKSERRGYYVHTWHAIIRRWENKGDYRVEIQIAEKDSCRVPVKFGISPLRERRMEIKPYGVYIG